MAPILTNNDGLFASLVGLRMVLAALSLLQELPPELVKMSILQLPSWIVTSEAWSRISRNSVCQQPNPPRPAAKRLSPVSPPFYCGLVGYAPQRLSISGGTTSMLSNQTMALPLTCLVAGCGVVGVRLGPETKSSRNKAVDMFLACQCLSGCHLGKWFHRARRSCGIGADYKECATRVFTHPSGTPWTSHCCYRHEFLCPSLRS
jgi:hypothetical protein